MAGKGRAGIVSIVFPRIGLRNEFLDNWSQGRLGSLNIIREVFQIVKQYVALVKRWCKEGL